MHTFSPSLKRRAAQVGAEMLERGDSIAEVPFGDTRDCLFVSRDGNVVNWTATVEVEGTTLYIGTKRIRAADPTNTST